MKYDVEKLAIRLLIVDDEAPQMTALCDTLRDYGYETSGYTSALEAITALRATEFDIVLSDLMMPEMDGIAFLTAALEIDPNLVGIIMTGHGTIKTAVSAMKVGALDYVLKPFKISAILPVLNRAATMRQLRTENIQLREIIGIYELCMALTFAMDYDTILEKIAVAAHHQCNHGDVIVMLPDETGREYWAAVTHGENSEKFRGIRVSIDAAMKEWITGFTIGSLNSEAIHAAPSGSENPLRHIIPGIAIPMISGGKVIGILIFNPLNSTRLVTSGKIKAMNILAGAGASALESALLLQQLRAAEMRYRRLAENAEDIIYRIEFEPTHRYRYVNQAIKSLTGYTPEELYNDPDFGIALTHPDDRHLIKQIYDGEFASGMTFTMRWICKNTAVVWVEQRVIRIPNELGQLIAIEGIVRDVTERKRTEEEILHLNQELEQRVRDRTADLEAAYAELESFSYSVSHDLRAPLRAIEGFSSILLKDFSSQLPDQTQYLLNRIIVNTTRMSQLIDDLLHFSKLQKQPLKKNPLKLHDLVSEVVAELLEATGDRTINIVVNPLPDCTGDLSLLRQVFFNLLANAIKFTRIREQAMIEVGCTPQTKEFIYYVRDNGAGFNMNYGDRLFRVFQRLHQVNAFEGTGLGLSLVKNIINRHGGRIWAEGKENKGATFYFSLPITLEENPISANDDQ